MALAAVRPSFCEFSGPQSWRIDAGATRGGVGGLLRGWRELEASVALVVTLLMVMEGGRSDFRKCAASSDESSASSSSDDSSSSSSSSSSESSSESSSSDDSSDSDSDAGGGEEEMSGSGGGGGERPNGNDDHRDNEHSNGKDKKPEEDDEEDNKEEMTDAVEDTQQPVASTTISLHPQEAIIDTVSSDSDSDNPSDIENAYPELPTAPVDALIALRRQAKQEELKLTKETKDEVVALARQHERERRSHRSKSGTTKKQSNGSQSAKKKKDKSEKPLKHKHDKLANVASASNAKLSQDPLVGGVAVVAAEESWLMHCSCGVHQKNYDDGTSMIQCDMCTNWVHASCAGKSPQEAENEKFICFECTWMFDCVCDVRNRKNHDDGRRMVECEGCKTWQHTDCVGILLGQDPPDHYRCPRCVKRKKRKHLESKKSGKSHSDKKKRESDRSHHRSSGSRSSKPKDLSASDAALALTGMIGASSRADGHGREAEPREALPISSTTQPTGSPPPPSSPPPPLSPPPPPPSRDNDVGIIVDHHSSRSRSERHKSHRHSSHSRSHRHGHSSSRSSHHHHHSTTSSSRSKESLSVDAPPPPPASPPPPPGVSPRVTRPPLPVTPKSPATTKPWETGGLHAPIHSSGKRKSGSARDRLEKKLKLKKSSR